MIIREIQTKFEAYLLTERRVSHNTYASYKNDIEQFVQFIEQYNYTLQTMLVADVKKFLRHLHDTAVGARSMARKISALKLFFLYVHERCELQDLAHELHAPRLEQKLPQYLTEDEVQRLFEVADSDTSSLGMRNKVMLYLLYASGMRISELTHLKVGDIRFDTGFVAVEGKGGKQRMIPLPDSVRTLLIHYVRGVHAAFARKRGIHIDYLFPTLYGKAIKPISRQAFWGILKVLCAKAGIERAISPHTLRHSLATHMLKQGMHLRSLQMILGHENLNTVQLYTHIETSHLRKVYDKKHPRS